MSRAAYLRRWRTARQAERPTEHEDAAARHALRAKAYYAANKAEVLEAQAAYRAANVDRIKAQQKAYREANRAKISARNRRKKYGIDADTLDILHMAQGGKCPICGDALDASGYRTVHVDHSHKSGVVRGLLCNRCNLGLGHFRENEAIMLSAIEYLKRHTQPLTADKPQA